MVRIVGGPAVQKCASVCAECERLNTPAMLLYSATAVRKSNVHYVRTVPYRTILYYTILYGTAQAHIPTSHLALPRSHEITHRIESWVAETRYIPTAGLTDAQLSSRGLGQQQPTVMCITGAIVQLANPSRSHEGVVLPHAGTAVVAQGNGWPQSSMLARGTRVGQFWTDVQQAHGRKGSGGSSDLHKKGGLSITQKGLGPGEGGGPGTA